MPLNEREQLDACLSLLERCFGVLARDTEAFMRLDLRPQFTDDEFVAEVDLAHDVEALLVEAGRIAVGPLAAGNSFSRAAVAVGISRNKIVTLIRRGRLKSDSGVPYFCVSPESLNGLRKRFEARRRRQKRQPASSINPA